MTKYIMIKGFLGRGINGTKDIRIKVDEIIDTVTPDEAKPFNPEDVVKIKGISCITRDNEKLEFIVPKNNILFMFFE